MQYTKLSASLLLLATAALARPAPQANVQGFASTTSASAPAATDKSTIQNPNAQGVLVALIDKNNVITNVVMDAAALAAGQSSKVIVSDLLRPAFLEVALGEQFPNKALRCAVHDHQDNLVFGTRGANFDTTFSDSNNGRWTLQNQDKTPFTSGLRSVICDPAFTANNRNPPVATATATVVVGDVTATATATATATPPKEDKSTFKTTDPNAVIVALWESEQSQPRAITMDAAALSNGGLSSVQLDVSPVYSTLELVLGENFANNALRCSVLNITGQEIFVLRGANRDTTFSDANNGKWKLETPSTISKVVCDAAFKANNRAGQ